MIFLAYRVFGHTLWWWLFLAVALLAVGFGLPQVLPPMLTIGLLLLALAGIGLLSLSFKG